jgi:Zn-dependent metalloprotease
MKFLLILGIAAILLAACNSNGEGLYCIKTIQNSPGTTVLSKSEMDEIKNLFSRNQLDFKKYQFTRFQKDELGHRHVRCYQFANNLIVFTSDAIFHFDNNGKYYTLSGELVNAISLDKNPSMSRDEVVEKFMGNIEQDGFNQGNNELISSCFDVEFGYYDLNAGISYADEKYVKAWKIKPRNSEYPFAYINDESSEIIYYDNGIRF